MPAGSHGHGLLDPAQTGARDAKIESRFKVTICRDLEVEPLQPGAIEGEVVPSELARGVHATNSLRLKRKQK